MAGSSFGTILRVTTFGESHGAAIGAVLDGFPAGMPLSEADIQEYLDRRKPGKSPIATKRAESDTVEILSGVFEGQTEGSPIAMLIRNQDQHSGDYRNLQDCFRPGHADYGYAVKYGIRDYRGGGRSSGRETAARVAAGAVAEKFLKSLGIDFLCYVSAIGPVKVHAKPEDPDFDRSLILSTPTAMPQAESNEEALRYLSGCMAEKDSSGGEITLRIHGVPAGIGDPVMNKLDARLAAAMMSIGAVKDVAVGDGTAVSVARGSANNDAFLPDCGNGIQTASNHAGGILGGISDGNDILIRLSVKPTPSIARPQQTVDTEGHPRELVITGRHDPVIVPRAVVVAETMAALVLLDSMMMNMSSKTEAIRRFYGRV